MKRLVKNIALVMLTIVSLSTVNAQVKGQLDVLRELGEGAEFIEYWGIYKEDDGKFTGKPFKAIRVLQFEYNIHNKLTGFSMNDKETGKTITNRGFKLLEPNHYTEPSVLHVKDQRVAWLYIDGLFYMIKGVKDPNSINNIKIEYILIPENTEVIEKEGEKKKLTMKEKIAAAKAAMTANGPVVPQEISEKDHIVIIKKYLADMKAVQEKATAAFTPEIKQEILDIENADADFLKLRQEQSRELAAKLNAKKEKEGNKGSNYTVKNTSNTSVKIITDSGSTTTLNAGSSTTYLCSVDIYYCVGQSTKGALIVDGDKACGATVEF